MNALRIDRYAIFDSFNVVEKFLEECGFKNTNMVTYYIPYKKINGLAIGSNCVDIIVGETTYTFDFNQNEGFEEFKRVNNL